MATSSRNDEALSRNDEALSRNDGALSRNDGAVFRNPKLWNSTELHRMETKRAIPSKCRPHVFVGLAWLFVTYMNRQGKQSQSESHWSITTLQSRAVHILEVGAGLSINAANHHVVFDLVHVLHQVGSRRFRRRFACRHCRFHDLPLLFLDRLDLRGVEKGVLEDQFAQSLNGIALLANSSDFVPGAVGGTRVGHGMAVVAVRVHFEHQWSFAAHAVLLGVLDSLLHCKRVHPVHLEARNVVPAFVVLW
mmetsp:Transcript_35713/g.57431  ORF Transcript_35713/g.57431 Transcript_35713/m.57431 type:complete len:249 (+) Transcript_35713:122-868(+)